ncbi:hypothetical protein MMPV_002336 [Pyropia vietnamensis]
MAAVSGGGAAGIGGAGGGASPGGGPGGLGSGPDGLARVERLCQQLYQGTDPASRAEAEATLLPLASSPRFVSECLWILDNSSDPYAQKLASWTLIQIVTQHWAQLSTPSPLELRNYILRYLAKCGPSLASFVLIELSSLLARLTKLGWTAEPANRTIVDDVSSFLDASEAHCAIGLALLSRLVAEMNTSASLASAAAARRSLTHAQHRRVASSFRDAVLLRIFKLSLSALAKFAAVPGKLRGGALDVALACLNFDFIGSSFDDTVEDVGTIQMPVAWRGVVQDPDTLSLFLDVYVSCTNGGGADAAGVGVNADAVDPVQSAKCLDALVQLVSVRRTLFASDDARFAYLRTHMVGMLSILRTRRGLDNHDNYHHFCRWLTRLKANYQLAELVATEGYEEWISLVASFTRNSLASDWRWVGDSLFYLLTLWARLVAAMPYLKGSALSHLDVHVQDIVKDYVGSRLRALRADAASGDDGDETEECAEQLDAIPVIFRLQYDKTASFLVSVMDPLLEQYQATTRTLAASLTAGPAGASVVSSARLQLNGLQRDLGWLVRVVGTVVGGRLSASSSESQELTDGELSARVFQLMSYSVEADRASLPVLAAIGASAPAGPFDTREGSGAAGGEAALRGAAVLDEAIIEFTQAFRKAYIGEQAVATSKVYVRMAERLGVADHMVVLDVVATKIAGNLHRYGVSEGEAVVAKSLSLLADLADGYSSSRLLGRLATVRQMIDKHGEDVFPFMRGPDSRMGRHRTTFYSTLTKILLKTTAGDSDCESALSRFFEPMRLRLSQLAAVPSDDALVRDSLILRAGVGVLRDLRGVLAATTSRRHYVTLWELLYPAHMPVLLRLVRVYSAAGAHTASVVALKFYSELSLNKAKRIVFDNSSPAGILLFREVSKALVAYGASPRVLADVSDVVAAARRQAELAERGAGPGSSMATGGGDSSVGTGGGSGAAESQAYVRVYKGAWVSMATFARALEGGYVNFGVFVLYGDPALGDALNVVMRLATAFPLDELLAYPKASRAYFSLLDVLCQQHTGDVFSLDAHSFSHVVASLQEGLQSLEVWMSSGSAVSLDHLSAYRFRMRSRDTPGAVAVRAQTEAAPDLFPRVLEVLFSVVLAEDCPNQWSLSRPLLSLILSNEEAFLAIQERTIASQSTAEARTAVAEAFGKLMADVRPNLESKNKDKFTQNTNIFRHAIRAITSGAS